MEDYDKMLKNAEIEYLENIKNIKIMKENHIFKDKQLIYIYNNRAYDDLDILKNNIDYDKIDDFFKKNLFYYKSCLNDNYSIKKFFIE